MANNDESKEKWKGQEVQHGAGQAEEAADRAEGKRPVLVKDAAKEGKPDLATEPETIVRRPPSHEQPEEKIEEAAEEHRARRASEAGIQRGKL